MTGFTFLHSSDLHLGRSFASLPEREGTGLRGRLTEARHAAIPRLAQAARDCGAAHIVLAGDSFDSATPSAPVWRQAMAAMAETDLTWWLLPGNHDNLRDAEPLWDSLRAEAPANLRPLTDTTTHQIAPGVQLLPVPVTFRNPGRDLTEDLLQMPTPEGEIRLGLAHGGVVDFSDGAAHIPPDRDRSAGLDYLALGDWHGRRAIGPRTHYPGCPEQDRFRHNRRGLCLAVTLPGPGALPQITEIETGAFLWQDVELPLFPDTDPAAALAAAMPDAPRRQTLVQVTAQGRTGLSGLAELTRAADQLAPDFAHFRLRHDALVTESAPEDLDLIDRAGALRLAADRLQAASQDPARAEADRQVAAAALNRLFSLAVQETPE